MYYTHGADITANVEGEVIVSEAEGADLHTPTDLVATRAWRVHGQHRDVF